MATNNAINLKSSGVVTYDAAGAFTASTLTNHFVLVGSSSNAITSVTPTANTGWVLTSNGTGSDPSFQAASSSATFYQKEYLTYTFFGGF
jgi:hypothetical protein